MYISTSDTWPVDYVLYPFTELGCTYIYRFLLRDIPDLAVSATADIVRLIVRYGAR